MQQGSSRTLPFRPVPRF